MTDDCQGFKGGSALIGVNNRSSTILKENEAERAEICVTLQSYRNIGKVFTKLKS